MSRFPLLTAAVVATAFAGSSQASIISADFYEVLTYGSSSYQSGEANRILENNNQAIGDGYELTGNHYVSGSLSDELRVDLQPDMLTLAGSDWNIFQSISIEITNIQFDLPGEVIAGVQMLTDEAVIADSRYGIDPLLNYSFTDDSITINYTPDLALSELLNGSGNWQDTTFAIWSPELESQLNWGFSGLSTFSVTTAAASVPAPATAVLMALGLGVIALRKRAVA